jgi:DNA adenine methylase
LQNPCYGQLLCSGSKFSQMILRRLGNKQAIAQDIIKYFPEHKIYFEPFFGAGGMFFNKPKAKYNVVNDLDSEVFNLFQVVINQKEELEKAFYLMPIHSDLFEYYKSNEQTDPIQKALRFLFFSNLTTIGVVSSGMSLSFTKNKNIFFKVIDKTYEMINDCKFTNYDFRKYFKTLTFNTDGRNDEAKSFFYCDPPYLGTNDNYSNSFTEQDSIDLFDCLQATGCKFAMSEFDNEFILNQAKERGLNVIIIGERKNLKNRRTEILITNYEKQKGLFD